MPLRRVVLITGSLITVAFGIYLAVLYRDLKEAFYRQEQFIPTRIYSDVTRIAPPQSRAAIEERLKALNYSYTPGSEQIQFKLHSPDYPAYLLPEAHPTLTAGDQTVTLHLSGTESDAALHSIDIGGREVPEIFLEPELVTTLSRGGPEKKAIRSLVKFNDIPAPIWQAILAVEDPRFMDHKGLDPRGIARAIWVNLRTRSLAQGGSTITLQLVKNLMARRTKNVVRKFNELFLALLLESTFDKEEILERYLNEVYLGQVGALEVHGVAEGAEHFFGKRIDELNLGEIALLAGLIRGPGYYSPYRHRDRAVERQKFVLKKMVESNYIAEAEAAEAQAQPIRLSPPQNVTNKAPFFTDFVKAEMIRELKGRVTEEELPEAGFRVYTTLDMPMNAVAQRSVSQGVSRLEQKLKLQAQDRLEGALAAIDHSTGYIRALVGGKSYAQSNFNRILNMKRQVGSTFKPIVFLTALQKGNDRNGVPYSPGYPIQDTQWTLTYDGGKQKWSPKNYENDFKGWISLRAALAHSVNTSTARLGVDVGLSEVIKTARTLGVESELLEVPSLTLGVAELSPIELLKVYATLANRGVQNEPTVIRAITQEDGTSYARFVHHPKQVADTTPIDLLTDMMQSVLTDGSARSAASLGFDRPAAGKTGTTSHHRDNWFAGFTPQLTAVVWVGMDQPPAEGKDEKNKKAKKVVLTGATSALPIWTDFMKDALASEPPTPFPLNPDLSNVTIDQRTGLIAAPNCPMSQIVTEKYIKGNEPKVASCVPAWPQLTHESKM